MNITITFFLGLIISFLGVVPPGLLNMTAAKISLREGYGRGIMFSIGACLIVALQTAIAASFAKYLSNHPDIVFILKQVAFVIFVLLTIFFLVIAKNGRPKPQKQFKIRSRKSRFFQGIFMSAINLFPIPFQAYMTLTLASVGLMAFDKTSIASYVAGATTGSFAMLYVYIFFFDKIKSKSVTNQKNMNYVIGVITGIVAVITLIGILNQ